ncbi:sulfite exporter TauE/SafE family protein [Vibrio hippocampi]|uniref:Urease accessory protein UreH-like transmembrane domain-containing protein n=1 Tax=Vibrio hippocampi TaxID=654686 RepID=A0ABM8ZH28_9VIBR|nr:sulfite exporter TauE/SafE family protein [Vibrio hippocampi]CAH0525981.1 hypothetical protein VHP8226_01463 [Vibrio hippocampi]
MTLDLVGAFTIGLLGAGHCIGMCGGIASLLTLNRARSWFIVINYNVGRLLSYALFGAVIGGAVTTIAHLADFNQLLAVLRLFSALVMVALAAYIGRWWNALIYVEKAGQGVWKRISPIAKRLLPIQHPIHAIPFGFIWGWLPCGLVYSALTWSAVSGSATNGALLMLAFGLGTLPAMLLVGNAATKLKALQTSPTFRNIAAFSILIYALYLAGISIKILV